MTRTYRHATTLELDVELEIEWSPGCPARGPRYDCAGEPAEPPEANIISASVGGVSIPLDAIGWDVLSQLEAEALERAIDDERDAFAAAAEDRADGEREERMLEGSAQ